MPHNILSLMSRNERRALLEREKRHRKTGNWPQWVRHILKPDSIPGRGWARTFTFAYVNEVFSVLERDAGHGVRHLMITSLSKQRPTWWEAQRIKNEIAGEAATAVEVYPPQSQVVDGADAYHLWVLPAPLAFGLHEGRRDA